MKLSKKTIRIIITVVMIIFAFALLEIAIRALFGLFGNVSDKIEEKKQEKIVYNSEKEKAHRQVTTFLDYYFDALKDGDYYYAFYNLHEAYRAYMFEDDIDKFEEYIKENFPVIENVEYTNINRKGGLYQVIASFTSGDSAYNKNLTVKIVGENECDLLFGDYNVFEKRSEVSNYKVLRYSLSYLYETSTAKVYVVDIHNNSMQDVSLEFNDVSRFVSTAGYVFDGTKPASSIIKPGETYRVRLAFAKDVMGESSLELDTNENGVKRLVKIYFSDEIF